MKTVRQNLIKEARRLWRLMVFEEFNGRCFLCGRPAHDPHHLIPARHLVGRFETKNGVALCRLCHGKVHDDMDIAAEVKERLPEKYEFWQKNKHKSCKMMNYEIKEKIEIMRKEKDNG